MSRILKLTLVFLLTALFFNNIFAFSRGIYLTQETAQNKTKMAYLIAQAKKYNIDTFVVDVYGPSKAYTANIKSAMDQGIHYVARIVIFPLGASQAQINDTALWAKRLKLAKYAISIGASAVQLDYIRYRSAYPADPEKARQVLKVVQYFKRELAPYKVSLQMDIFGIATIKPAHTIGQDPGALASAVNAFCPMVYPSHYEPYREYATKPYKTVYDSVVALRKQISAYPNVGIYPYIELFNYRYKMSPEQRMDYIRAEMKAAHDGGADGWYVWSATNHYSPLFQVLASGGK